MKLLISLFLSTFVLMNSVQGYFYVPTYMNKLPFKGGMAAAQSNNSLYLFGGENATTAYTNDLYQLTQTSTSYDWKIVEQKNRPNGTVYSKAIITADGQNMVLLGGMSNSTFGRGLPLQIYNFNFATQTWSAHLQNGVTNITEPIPANFVFNREYFSATYDAKNQKTYVYGGAITKLNTIFNTLHVYDSEFKATALKATPYGRYGHTTSILSTGQLVVIGGVNGATGTLADMTSVWVYDPSSDNWTGQNVSAPQGTPSTGSDRTAVVTSDDKIILFGGDSGSIQRTRQYLNSIAILDTKTWSWSIPSITGIPPSRRSFAVGGILDDKHLTVAFGSSSNSYYNDINTYDLQSGAWLQSFSESSSSGDGSVSKGLIAGVTVAAVVLLVIILFLLWKFQSYIRWLVTRIHNDIWKPRTGEPVWAETGRIVSQVFFLFFFVMFLYFVIRQAIDSPNVVQRIEYSTASVEVPDVRFCYDGFPAQSAVSTNGDSGAPGVSCQTDNGYSCSQFVKTLDMSIFQPTFSDNLGAVNCFLFRAPEEFQLTSTSGANNGSRLLFTLYGDQATTYGRVHVSIFPKKMDPNAKIYPLGDDIVNYLSEFDVLNWQNAERNDLQATNVFTIAPFTYSALSYDIVNHKYLQPVGWNYVGFLPVTNSTPEIESNFRSEAPNPTYSSGHTDLGLVAVFPQSYAILEDREVKMYTLVNALGFVGGIFGLLIGAQAWLFGYRPRSPWGVVHRWSTGSRKQSLLSGLQAQFKTADSGIPLVHPVHHRFSKQVIAGMEPETEAQRVSRVEERMQILELLFKAYYVDDEVFRSLDNAAGGPLSNKPLANVQQPYTNQQTPSSLGIRENPFFLSTEKLNPYPSQQPSGDNQNGFSHMFNERQSRGSISSDANSQHQLNSAQDVHLRDMR
ncbi:hypothetical protein INT47_000801 [Mucor saturninus]|uniref:Galactose oxidase n=1 Tax=Mucor saturninus TaxID=64648 RepID=A0A8H7RPG7_9FUNG|nr:hypothetical protein INT47_000801 [Mucor saturninus]